MESADEENLYNNHDGDGF